MPHAQSVLALALIVRAAFAMAQEPICNPCVDGPEMFEHRRGEVQRHPPTLARERAQREAVTMGRAITEADLLAYASAPYDKSALYGKRIPLGSLNGVGILVDHWCSNICPEYTVRVIYFVVPPEASCDSVGGVEKSVSVPMGVLRMREAFCFPRILVDHWDAYIR